MRSVLTSGLGYLTCALVALGCNAVLNNESGELADSGTALEDASPRQDAPAAPPPVLDATVPVPTVDAGPTIPEDADTIPSCAFGQKLCNGACVSVNDPLFGCGTTTCTPCSLEHATATCAGNGCAVAACDPGYADCSSGVAGCATSLSEPGHCGACNVTCGTTAPYCAPTSTSGQFGCTDECPSTAPTLCGAECVDLSSSVDDCGACGSSCPVIANGDATCAGGHCGFTCDADFHACAAACASDLDPATCGASCAPCPTGPDAVATCDGRECGLVCEPGFGNCDGNASDGCEADLENDPTNCGVCGVSCNGRACLNGACAPPQDAGTSSGDSGSPPVDAGEPPQDAGSVGRDSGSTTAGEGGASD